jgi:hypothetical protein
LTCSRKNDPGDEVQTRDLNNSFKTRILYIQNEMAYDPVICPAITGYNLRQIK